MRTVRLGQYGVTMIEFVASIVIISIAVLGLILVTAGVAGRTGDPMPERQASAIAHAYMEEVMLANFCDPDFLTPGQTCQVQCVASACSAGACGGVGPLKEATRDLYDDVCDYNGLGDAGARDCSDSAISGLSLYTVSVSVMDGGITLGTPAIDSNAGEVVRIDVNVSHAALDSDFNLSGFRAKTPNELQTCTWVHAHRAHRRDRHQWHYRGVCRAQHFAPDSRVHRHGAPRWTGG